MTYALYHLKIGDRTVELTHGHDLPLSSIIVCDQWLEGHREREAYRYRRDRLAELKETHGCGDRPEWRIDQ